MQAFLTELVLRLPDEALDAARAPGPSAARAAAPPADATARYLAWRAYAEGGAKRGTRGAVLFGESGDPAANSISEEMDRLLTARYVKSQSLCGNQPVSWDVGAKLQNALARSNRSRFG